MDTEIFFDTGTNWKNAYGKAKVICASCPVKELCLQDQLDWERNNGYAHERHGFFGGKNPVDRRRLLGEKIQWQNSKQNKS